MNYRHELKYTISASSAEILKHYLSKIMDVDSNSKNEDLTYKIRSLYFDNDSSDAYYEKLNGVLYRAKYRIRYYNDDESFIRLECKMKHNNLTAKRQMVISREICDKIINNEIKDIESDGLLKDFLDEINRKNLKPSIIVDYKRLAYTYPISDVRITFDSKVRSGRYEYGLFEHDFLTYNVMKDDEIILEVKFNEILPESIAIILSIIPACRQAISKFALCRSIK